MSVANEPDMVGLHDPAHYPPRRQPEKPERQPVPDDVHPAPRHSETAAPQSLRRPLESGALGETRASARRGTLFGGTGSLAAAIGVSAVVALLVVTMMPATQQPDGRQSFSAVLEPFTSALSQQHQGDDAPRPALAEFEPLLAGNDTGQAVERAQTDRRQSGKVLQQFLHWRQKANPSAAAQ